ncbi:hypothetical protein PIROE2DRAFT_1547 [Piromyces sp. E2]|nr:hypothetical protein PIROE2DRAFT_1547 [Piromyces sp. E2]|eukprot:OUM70387.1 hypothetical protein PIROE2DRAFT_1547 [Piromyces sp. E2]
MRVSSDDRASLTIGASTEKYLKLSEDNGFPGADFEEVDIEINKKGSIVISSLEKETSVTINTCKGNGNPDSGVCIKTGTETAIDLCAIGGKYYETKSSSCVEITRLQGSTVQLYYDKDWKVITSPSTATTTIKYVYECVFKSSETATKEKDAESCTQFIGYKEVKVSTSSYGLHCDGISCKLESLDCTNNDYAKLKSGGNICFGGRIVPLPSEDNEEKVRAFTSTTVNKYFSEYGVIFLKLEKNLVTLAAAGDVKKGYYVNESVKTYKNGLIYCSEDGDFSKCSVVDATNGYYTTAAGDNYYITCKNNICDVAVIENTTCGFSNILPDCTRNGPQTGDVCLDDGANDTHCMGSDGKIYKNLVDGDGNKSCAVIELTSETPSASFNADGTQASDLGVSYYTCNVSGGVSDCVLGRKKLPTCKKSVGTNGACIEGDSDGVVCITTDNKLLKTGSDGESCEAVTGASNSVHYFGDDRVEKEGITASADYIYKCASSASSNKALSGCAPLSQKPGGIIKTASGMGLCVSEDDNEVIENGSSKVYMKVNVKGGVFPDVSADIAINIKISGTGSLIQLKETSTYRPSCPNTIVATDACKSGNEYLNSCIKDGVIFRTYGKSCGKLESDETINGFVFFRKDYSQVNPDAGDTDIALAYQCMFDSGGRAKQCQYAKGFVVTEKKVVNCNGWKGDECLVMVKESSSDCSSSNGEGGIKAGEDGICFGSSTVNLPADSYTYTAFKTDDINEFYGFNKDQIVFLKLTSHSALVISPTELDGEVYFIDQVHPENADDKTPLIKCNSEDCSLVESGTVDRVTGTGENAEDKVVGKAHTYYVDGAYPFGQQIITCTYTVKGEDGTVSSAGSCVSAAPTSIAYFVDHGIEGNLITCSTNSNTFGYGDLPVCEEDANEEKTCVTGAASGSLCVRGGKLFVSQTSEDKCLAVTTYSSAPSLFGLYVTGASDEDKHENLIVCDGEGVIACHYVDNVTGETDCVDAENNNAPANEGVIFTDSTNEIFMRCHEGKGEALTKVKNQGYMLMEPAQASKIFNGVAGTVLLENNGIVSLVQVEIGNGYYMNVGFDLETYSVIECTERTGCTTVNPDDLFCYGEKGNKYNNSDNKSNHNKYNNNNIKNKCINNGNKVNKNNNNKNDNNDNNTSIPTCTNTLINKKCREDAEAGQYCIKDGKLYHTLDSQTENCKEVNAYEDCASLSNPGTYTLCIQENKIMITLESGLTDVSGIPECESTNASQKCVAGAAAGDHCRTDDKIYRTGDTDCSMKKDGVYDRQKEIIMKFEASAILHDAGTVTSVYRCVNKNGVLTSCERSVMGAGGLIGNASGPRVCVNHETVVTDNSMALTMDGGSNKYRSFFTEKLDAFPGSGNPDRRLVRFEKNKAELVKGVEPLPDCDAIINGKGCQSGGLDVNYCIDSHNVMYVSSGQSCQKSRGTGNSYRFFFFTDDHYVIPEAEVNGKSEVAFAYKCHYDDNGEAERCMMARGYLLKNNLILNCSGWFGCTITGINSKSRSCVDAGEGTILGNGAKICFGEDKAIPLPTDSSTKYVVFKAGLDNAIYGRYVDDVVVLALTRDSVTVVPFGKGIAKGYHQNVKVVGTLTQALIYCEEEGVLEKCRIVDGLNGYYLNADSDATDRPVIKCEVGVGLGCRKQSVNKTTCSEHGAIIKSGGIKVCKSKSNTGAFDLADASTTIYDYINEIDASFPGTIEENKSFVKIGMDGSVTLMDEGVYLNEGVNGKVGNALYHCSTANVATVCNLENANYGYYRNAATIRVNDTFLACSINGCQGIEVDAYGFCSKDFIGKLVGSSDSPTLCLDYDQVLDEGVDITLTGTEKEHDSFMIAFLSNNIFGLEENDYAYVDVTSDAVKLKSNVDTKYIYTLDYKEKNDNWPASEEEKEALYPTLNEFKMKENGIYNLNCEEGEEKDNLCTKMNE